MHEVLKQGSEGQAPAQWPTSPVKQKPDPPMATACSPEEGTGREGLGWSAALNQRRDDG